MYGGDKAASLGFAARNYSARISELFDVVGWHNVAKRDRDRHVGNDPPLDFHDGEFGIGSSVANVRAEGYLQSGAEGNAVDCGDYGDRQGPPDVRGTLIKIRGGVVTGLEGIFVQAVQTITLKNREVDTRTEVVTCPAQDDGSNVRILCQSVARFDKRFEHGKIDSIVFFGPVERNLCNMIFDFDRNSVTHSLLPRRRLIFGSQSSSALRHFGSVVCICFVFANTALASEYPEPGIFEVVQSESEIRVLVFRAGLLAGFGHNHLISTSDIAGRIEITEDPAASCVELTIPVESFEVDNKAARLEEGEQFERELSEKDVLSTRNNMLGPGQLDSASFPSITIRSQSWSGELAELIVNAELTVRDHVQELDFPALVSVSDEQIVVTGIVAMTHEQLGLEPFTAVLGSLRVRDEIEIRFLITARRVHD